MQNDLPVYRNSSLDQVILDVAFDNHSTREMNVDVQ